MSKVISGGKLERVVDDTADLVRNPLAGITIAIDGPSSSGKGTLAKTLARRYRLKFLDTGALYRAVAFKVMQAGGECTDGALAERMARGLMFDFKHKGNNEFGIWVDGTEVTDILRSPEVGAGAGVVAAHKGVRAALLDFQVGYAKHWKPLVGVVLDGRDTGARIAPDAEVKLFLVGDVQERARWRWLEFVAMGKDKTLDAVVAELTVRDARDEPNTIQTHDAVVIDVTQHDRAGVLAAAIAAVEARVGVVPIAPEGV